MSSEIGRKDKLQAASNRLSLLGTRQISSRLDTTSVKPVLEIDPQYLGPTVGDWGVDFNSGSVDLSGLAASNTLIIPALAGLNAYVQTLELNFSVPADAAPATVQLRGYYDMPVGQPFRAFDFLDLFATTGGGVLMRFALGGFTDLNTARTTRVTSWDGFLPAEVPFRLEVEKAIGGIAFPFGSSFQWRRLLWTWPVGTLKPF